MRKSMIWIVLTAAVVAGCGAPNDVTITSLGGANENFFPGFDEIPGGGGGSLETARAMSGVWVGPATVLDRVGALIDDAPILTSGDLAPQGLEPPASGRFNVVMELGTSEEGVISGSYADDIDNFGTVLGSVTQYEQIVLEARFQGGSIEMTGVIEEREDFFGIESIYTGTYVVRAMSGTAWHNGTFEFIRTAGSRDLRTLAFKLQELSEDDFDIIVETPDGTIHDFTSPYYSEGVTQRGIPDILALPADQAPVGLYTVHIDVFSNNTGEEKNVTLQAWENGYLTEVIWQGTVRGNVEPGIVVTEFYNYGGE